ncbi:MAG: hypothetical protein OEY19_06610 [Gammaproteobacteria bacterium]|nr:hypothetical protein [Gammaproteobacteria bacterium]
MENITFIQSNLQGFVNRLINSYRLIIITVTIPILLTLIFELKNKPGLIELQILIWLPVMITMWLIFFNSGSNKLQACELIMNNEFISVSKYGETTLLRWNEITRFTVSKYINNKVTLLSDTNKMMEFDYYAFGIKQRSRILKYITLKLAKIH